MFEGSVGRLLTYPYGSKDPRIHPTVDCLNAQRSTNSPMTEAIILMKRQLQVGVLLGLEIPQCMGVDLCRTLSFGRPEGGLQRTQWHGGPIHSVRPETGTQLVL